MENGRIGEEANPSPNSSSDYDSDDNSDEELESKLAHLLAQVKDEPSNYEAHLQLVTALRKLGELDRLREARRTMADAFPLPPYVWIEWIGDERRMLSPPIEKEKVDAILELCSRATQDYLDIPLWLSALEFAIEQLEEDEIRKWFERSLSCCGWHTTCGHQVWELFRSFEASLGPESDAEGDNAVDNTHHAIRNLYFRELSAPLSGMDSVMSEYLTWEREQTNSEPQPEFFKTYELLKSELDRLQPFEDYIASLAPSSAPGSASPERLAAWSGYLSDVLARCGDERPTQCIVLFERALADAFLSPDMWLRYLAFLQQKFNHVDFLTSIFARALRNCPWSGLIWERYTRFLDSESGVRREFDVTMMKVRPGLAQVCGTSPDEAVAIYLALASIARRIANLGQPGVVPQKENDIKFTEVLKGLCVKIQNLLPRCYCDDTFYNAMTFLLHVLGTCLGDQDIATELCEAWVGARSQDPRSWLAYVAIARNRPKHVATVRAIFKRAMELLPADWRAQAVARDWLSFERCEGLPSEYRAALSKCEPLLGWSGAGLTSALPPAPPTLASSAEQEGSDEEPMPARRRGREAKQARHELTGGKTNTRKVKHTSEQPGQSSSYSAPDIAGRKRKRGASPTVRSDASSGAARAREDQAGPEKKAKVEEPLAEAPVQEGVNTCFVLNLAWDVTDAQLKSVFERVGPVEAVRHVRNNKGFSKGFAYIEMLDPQHVPKAVAALNGLDLRGRKIQVSVSQPQSNKGKGLDGKTVFIKNLPQLPQAELEAVLQNTFARAGSLTELRWARDHSGNMKRFCYAEFDSEAAAEAALALHGQSIGRLRRSDEAETLETNCVLVVEKTKSKNEIKKPKKNFEKALLKKVKTKARNKVSLLPRSVALQRADNNRADTVTAAAVITPGDGAEFEDDSSEGEKEPLVSSKSNADFRAMLLKR